MVKDYSYLLGNQFAKGHKSNITAFPKGNIPWNKGLKGIHNSPKTEFKKGQPSNKWMPIGSVTQRKDKSGIERFWVKIEEPKKWIENAKFIWLQNGGTIPKGFVVHHIDNNALNDDIDNLCLITRGVHINLHRGDLLNGKETNRGGDHAAGGVG